MAAKGLVGYVEETVGVVQRERALVPLREPLAHRGERGRELGLDRLREAELLLHRAPHLAQRLVGAVLKLELHLAERRGWRAHVVDRERAEQRLPAEPAEALAVVSDAGANQESLDRVEPRERVEQSRHWTGLERGPGRIAVGRVLGPFLPHQRLLVGRPERFRLQPEPCPFGA